jgi:hypothetical protein
MVEITDVSGNVFFNQLDGNSENILSTLTAVTVSDSASRQF